MKGNEILALLDEPACEHNHKQKSGCSAPKPGATAGGCAFDGAQITLLPIADVAHLVHGPIGCAGSSWDNRGSASSDDLTALARTIIEGVRDAYGITLVPEPRLVGCAI